MAAIGNRIRIGCVVQGDLRVPVGRILNELRRHCDQLILSTWEDQRFLVPPGGGFEAVFSRKPAVAGITNRNMQRRSTAAGMAAAAATGCTHILKWRTDMLPTKLNREQLLAWCHERPLDGFSSRIVVSSFRNLTVEPDWFSSFPDLFAFGETRNMQLLWGDDEFNYGQPYNMPTQMLAECDLSFPDGDTVVIGRGTPTPVASIFDAHIECYAIYKDRLQRLTGQTWSHEKIVRSTMRLIDHHHLGICWLRPTGTVRLRSITQAANLPWWTEGHWYSGSTPGSQSATEYINLDTSLRAAWQRRIVVYSEIVRQVFWYWSYRLLGPRALVARKV